MLKKLFWFLIFYLAINTAVFCTGTKEKVDNFICKYSLIINNYQFLNVEPTDEICKEFKIEYKAICLEISSTFDLNIQGKREARKNLRFIVYSMHFLGNFCRFKKGIAFCRSRIGREGRLELTNLNSAVLGLDQLLTDNLRAGKYSDENLRAFVEKFLQNLKNIEADIVSLEYVYYAAAG
ncbi:TPA: hypothetical protein DEO28_00515 [Candidatus Dependentiae bacterium]|nr:MAG: hypothetical protein UR14_C0001G0046 [candidate division TM6 bacterium GW2011_GWE2_31_21]KKP54074.1 MAG: hypothetical protein UR43_C0001G0092 [candidate division TM6 bacterium GW2011_GWF2_33_332]HBS48344.1 hypothetical protein [Candidatus Dependentiae bacterium]HBZ72982.1 hypothetical protein [Candidatus Dependentiae bacterium]